MNCWPVLCAVLLATLDTVTAAGTLRVRQNEVAEWRGTARAAHVDPFNELTLDALVTLADGSERRIPAFWAGNREWRFRFSSPATGQFPFRTVCSDTNDTGLHDQRGTIEVMPYRGQNLLLRHGPVQLSANRRYFAHADGASFTDYGLQPGQTYAYRVRAFNAGGESGWSNEADAATPASGSKAHSTTKDEPR